MEPSTKNSKAALTLVELLLACTLAGIILFFATSGLFKAAAYEKEAVALGRKAHQLETFLDALERDCQEATKEPFWTENGFTIPQKSGATLYSFKESALLRHGKDPSSRFYFGIAAFSVDTEKQPWVIEAQGKAAKGVRSVFRIEN